MTRKYVLFMLSSKIRYFTTFLIVMFIAITEISIQAKGKTSFGLLPTIFKFAVTDGTFFFRDAGSERSINGYSQILPGTSYLELHDCFPKKILIRQ